MKSFSLLTLGILILTCSAPTFADTTTEKTAEVKPIKVPFTLLSSGHFLVTVKLNDKGPYKLIFDTGAPTMLLNNRIAKDSGITGDKKGGGSMFSPFGSMAMQNIKTFEMGELKAEKVPAMVFDHPLVTAFSNAYKKAHGPIDGIVGFPFFARYTMTVDYQAKELTFVPNGYKPADVMQAMMNSIMAAQNNKGQAKMVQPGALLGLQAKKDKADEEPGVTVETVSKESAAEQAGLKVGDRLLTVDGRWTDSLGDLYTASSFLKPGKTVKVTLLREGKEVTLSLTPRKGA